MTQPAANSAPIVNLHPTGVVWGGLAAAAMCLLSAAGQPAATSSVPPIVAPAADAGPPSDAIILFDGQSLAGWVYTNGKPAEWIVEGDAMTVKPGSGSIVSKEKFSDAQIHLEFATPSEVHGNGQERGNSGMYIQGRYELQILDSFQNETYPNGQCSAIYGQYPPLVNASRGPGEWQTYDVIFRAPKFDAEGNKVAPGTMTVFHNGVLTQDHVELKGVTGGSLSAESAEPGPLMLQDHGNRMRFRNIWYRPLNN